MSSRERHADEAERNAAVWQSKALLREVYADLYRRIDTFIDPALRGEVVEIGCGVGNFKSHRPETIGVELWPAPGVDLACDAYDLPLRHASVSHFVLFDVFHHLRTPNAFLAQAHDAAVERGRMIVLEPYVSLVGSLAYGLFHPEPVAMREPIDLGTTVTRRDYYAAQGNATRLFFGDRSWLRGWRVLQAERFASFAYLLSGGFSRPALYPRAALPMLRAVDRVASRFPRLLAARCLIVLERS